MSLDEIKASLTTLSLAELEEVGAALRQAKCDLAAAENEPFSTYFGCARGTVTFQPGWDEPDTELWSALKDGTPR